MRRGMNDPNPPDQWNLIVSRFVTDLLQNTKTTEKIEAFLISRQAVKDARGVWVVNL